MGKFWHIHIRECVMGVCSKGNCDNFSEGGKIRAKFRNVRGVCDVGRLGGDIVVHAVCDVEFLMGRSLELS